MKLNTLFGSTKKEKKRLGRGIGSSKGKTSGRGHKGQKSRSGVAIKSFEGGQMPLYRRLPKRGFKNFKKDKLIALINLSTIQKCFEKKTISPKDVIDLNYLQKRNLISKKYKKIRLLGSGDIKDPIQAKMDFISVSAKKKVEKLGGKIILNNTKA